MAISIAPQHDSASAPTAADKLAALQRAMPAAGGTLYGIADAAVDEQVFDLLQAELETGAAWCLYDGYPAIRYARHAPYLVKMQTTDSPLIAQWLEHGWSRHWGVFVASPLAADRLKRHFKRFLEATSHDGRRVWVRFYDPRVLPCLLAGMNPGHLAEWFGKGAVAAWLAPKESTVWRATPAASKLDRMTNAARLAIDHFNLPNP